MAEPILCKSIASISELKQSPEKTVASADGEAIAILSYNRPMFYCVPKALFERMIRATERADPQS